MPILKKAPQGLNVKPNKVFGAPIVETEAKLPPIINDCINYLIRHGLKLEGIFRVSGKTTDVQKLVKLFSKNKKSNFEKSKPDPHAVAGCLKLWFRMLPTPLLTYAMYDPFIAAQENKDWFARVASFRELVKGLPKQNQLILEFLLWFLYRVWGHADVNKMTSTNLAVVFGPNLLREENPTDPRKAFEHSALINDITQCLIEQFDYLYRGKQAKPPPEVIAQLDAEREKRTTTSTSEPESKKNHSDSDGDIENTPPPPPSGTPPPPSSGKSPSPLGASNSKSSFNSSGSSSSSSLKRNTSKVSKGETSTDSFSKTGIGGSFDEDGNYQKPTPSWWSSFKYKRCISNRILARSGLPRPPVPSDYWITDSSEPISVMLPSNRFNNTWPRIKLADYFQGCDVADPHTSFTLTEDEEIQPIIKPEPYWTADHSENGQILKRLLAPINTALPEDVEFLLPKLDSVDIDLGSVEAEVIAKSLHLIREKSTVMEKQAANASKKQLPSSWDAFRHFPMEIYPPVNPFASEECSAWCRKQLASTSTVDDHLIESDTDNDESTSTSTSTDTPSTEPPSIERRNSIPKITSSDDSESPAPTPTSDKSPRSGSGITKSPRSGSNIKKSPRSGSNIKKSPRSGSNIKNSPRSGSNIKKSPRSGSGIQKSPSRRPGSKIRTPSDAPPPANTHSKPKPKPKSKPKPRTNSSASPVNPAGVISNELENVLSNRRKGTSPARKPRPPSGVRHRKPSNT